MPFLIAILIRDFLKLYTIFIMKVFGNLCFVTYLFIKSPSFPSLISIVFWVETNDKFVASISFLPPFNTGFVLYLNIFIGEVFRGEEILPMNSCPSNFVVFLREVDVLPDAWFD